MQANDCWQKDGGRRKVQFLQVLSICGAVTPPNHSGDVPCPRIFEKHEADEFIGSTSVATKVHAYAVL